jgi:hypothetical protein
MNYTTLTGAKSVSGSIKSWINYSNIPVTEILAEAETEIIRKLRVREMRASATVTIASGAITAALPSGFIDPIRLLHRDSGIPFKSLPPDDLQELRLWDESAADHVEGMPTRFSVFDELLQFDMKADAAYTCKIIYFKRPDALSGANETNWLTTRYPRLLRIACLRSAYEHMKNAEMKASYEAEMRLMLAEIEQESDLSMIGADPHLEYRDHG